MIRAAIGGLLTASLLAGNLLPAFAADQDEEARAIYEAQAGPGDGGFWRPGMPGMMPQPGPQEEPGDRSESNTGSTSSEIDLSSGGSLYQYQWGLKNNGNIQRVTSSLSIPITRAPGERSWRNVAENGMSAYVTETVTNSVEGTDINIEPAWEYYESTSERRSVTVALIDTGVDITHSELQNAIWVNEDEIPGDGIDNDGNGYIDDVNGWNFFSNTNEVYAGSEDDHGTHGAGTIAAAWDGTGTTGIADSDVVKIMVLKALGTEAGYGTADSIIEAIQYAEANGADICNLSLGAVGYSEQLKEAIENSSMLFVISAGNGDSAGIGYDIDTWPVYPASFDSDNIISVANLMFDGSLDESSNFGATGVDVAAPGTYILSTTTGGGYGFMSGTSMAAPMVTGVAALVYSCRTDLTLADVRNAILSSARQVDGLAGKLASGGIVDAYAAITYGL
ncbi:MAG: S8 family serine peptidase [Clostridiales bacterium]|nr:S8 family serine peptidase [Clostridiales bacterium]